MMLLVSGCTVTMARLAPLWGDCLGHLLTPNAGNSIPTTGLKWAADNACFSGFNPERFRRFLAKIRSGVGCLFVVVPDVVGNARETLALFQQWRDEVALTGHPLALVGQDGAEDCEIPWDEFGAWFVGGSTEWKLSQASADLCQEAKRRGKWVHIGRVNSRRRMEVSHSFGADSIDGTSTSRFGETYINTYCQWIEQITNQGRLFSGR